MKEFIKSSIRKILNFSNLDLTKNLKYDRLTGLIFKRVINPTSNCIDVGCHKGEMLDLMIKYSPKGEHMGFEPIPSFYKNLEEKYKGRAKIYPFALSNKKGETTFQYVKNAPAYSGIKKRKYDVENPEIEKIKVQLETLDNLVEPTYKIDLIKIDVEGAEFGVLKGAVDTIKRDKPIIIFEFGLGASDYYGTTPEDIYSLISSECGLSIYKLDDWIKGKPAMNLQQLDSAYHKEGEYYFVASK